MVIGNSVGPFEIKRELAAGGMGTVHLAEGDGQTVAVEVVHPRLIATPGFFKRFLREAELVRRVERGNVVRTAASDLHSARLVSTRHGWSPLGTADLHSARPVCIGTGPSRLDPDPGDPWSMLG